MVVLVLPNVITEPSYVSKNKGTSECNKKLVLPNVKLVSFNVSKKNKRESWNVTKVRLYVMLVLHKLTMEPFNISKKMRVQSNVKNNNAICGQCVDGTIQY